MKKTILKAAGILAAAAVLFTACSADDEGFDSRIDTVLYLERPQVKAVAYPGVNIVSWNPVTGAKGYMLYVYEEGVFVDKQSVAYNGSLVYTDTDVKNGKNRTYYVEAESKTSTSRAVNTENSRSDGVTVRGILPPADTKSLELYAYENYGTKKAPKGNADYVVSADNLKIARDENNKLTVSLPMKAYLEYDVYYTCGNELETLGEPFSRGTSQSSAVNDVTGMVASTSITAPGVYRAVVVADARNSLFGTSDAVVSSASVTVENLNASGASMTSASYTDSVKGDTVRVYFDGAMLSDGKNAPASYYKVYRSVKGTYDYTPVSGTITETAANANSFYVEDKIEDNSVDYVYTLVVTDGTRFANVSSSTKTVSAFSLGTQSKVTIGRTVTGTDIAWTITLPSTNVKIDGVYVLERSATSNLDDPVPAEFSTAVTPAGSGTSYTASTTGHAAGSSVYLLVKTSQSGKQNADWISDAVDIN